MVNPQQSEAQVAGSFAYGLSAMLYGESTVKGEVGEPTIAVAAPAVLNTTPSATGKRVRDLQLKNFHLGVI